MQLQFYIRFHTRFGQSLWLSGNSDELGDNDLTRAIALEYLNDEFWTTSIEVKKKGMPRSLTYRYILKNEDGDFLSEWGNDRIIELPLKSLNEIQLVDTWNHAGEYENAFYTDAFNKVLLKTAATKGKFTTDKNFTHVFNVKAPLLQKHELICISGSGPRLGEWSEENPIIMGRKGDWWKAKLDLCDSSFPLAYKYGVYNTQEKSFRFEKGDNRLVFSDAGKKKTTLLHDGFVHQPNDTWKGAGVAIPVFSLRSKNGFGVGEFNDIKLLVDWAKNTGMKLIQLLPVNDTMSTLTWMDSYPYSAISAFALHPIYINLEKVAGKEYASQLKPLKVKQRQLNEESVVNYEEVMKFKYSILKELYDFMGPACMESIEYTEYFEANKDWLEPYAAFCFLRDKFETADFEKWKTNGIYRKAEIDKLCTAKSTCYKQIAFYYFTQYQLHLQLKEAVEYAHKKGIVLKGDIPIGISRNSCDAWVSPGMYNLCWQAGAPPDDFTAVGQNWSFPTYNWKRMQEDGFAWWKQRFGQLSNYFDAFRIDHILGFFRIWSIPANAVQGIMGRFVPCLAVHINEFGENGIWFNYERYCNPFINDQVLEEIFGERAEDVKEKFLMPNELGGYDMGVGFETQKSIETYFNSLDESDENEKLKLELYDLISNVILFEDKDANGEQLEASGFHFRISMEKTSSFRYLAEQVREKLIGLYINYFYRRQDDFWYKEAMNKLPKLKASTNMLVCGEDLGMVPHCVPDVMQQLGILSLEIQRMPKDPQKEFFHPSDAPYMSVITPSTHDMSTLRGWWEEKRDKTQYFYNHVLGQWGDAPYYCEAWINRAIVLQHLYSPAMWSIFQLQDILGMSEGLRRDNPHEERINNPANPKHYWQYRMHITLEELVKEKDFNEELAGYVANSGRS